MSRVLFYAAILGGLIAAGPGMSEAWAAQLSASINPGNESSPFSMKYLKTVFIQYPGGGALYDELSGQEWAVTGAAGPADPGVQDLVQQLNKKIVSDGSHTQISDLDVSYDFALRGGEQGATIDFKVELEGALTGYIITSSEDRTQIDLGWRGISTADPVVIDGVDINIPINLLETQEPGVHAMLAGTEADEILGAHIINADFILAQPMTNWHFLFDPTGINADGGLYGMSDELAGVVLSIWSMGESSIREGIQVEQEHEVELALDREYVVKSVQSADAGNLSVIGYGVLDRSSDGVEFAGVTAERPEGTGDTGDFSVMIMYGMAGMAAIAGIAFFFVSNRTLKNEKQGQQGIDPSRLVGYQTSASAGGYQTNRGEAQLRDDSDYQQTRNVYDTATQQQRQPDASTTAPPPPQLTASSSAAEDAACGCAASADMGSGCDCTMQSSCLCDATCQCGASICKDQADSMR